MPEDPDIRLSDADTDEVYSPERKRMGPDKKKVGFFVAVGAVVFAVFGGIYLMMGSGGGISREEARLLGMKLSSLEQKVVVLEKQQAELQARIPAEGTESVSSLAGKIDTLAQRVETLEKKPVPVAVAPEKPKPAPAEKAVASPSAKKTHTVQKGDTVYRISKKYGITQAELRKLNNLGEEDPVKPGQKLVVSK
jgi:LysM repeat protein